MLPGGGAHGNQAVHGLAPDGGDIFRRGVYHGAGHGVPQHGHGGADGGYHLSLFCNHIADAVFAAQPRHNGRAAASAAHQAQKLRVQLIILQHGLHSFIHALYGFIQNRLCKGLRLLAVLLPQHREALLHIFQIAEGVVALAHHACHYSSIGKCYGKALSSGVFHHKVIRCIALHGGNKRRFGPFNSSEEANARYSRPAICAERGPHPGCGHLHPDR